MLNYVLIVLQAAGTCVPGWLDKAVLHQQKVLQKHIDDHNFPLAWKSGHASQFTSIFTMYEGCGMMPAN